MLQASHVQGVQAKPNQSRGWYMSRDRAEPVGTASEMSRLQMFEKWLHEATFKDNFEILMQVGTKEVSVKHERMETD